MKKYLLILFLILLIPTRVMAAGEPIEITADEALEWDRAQHVFTASGNAVIIQGQSKISAPKIIANYNETGKGIKIETITASPNATLVQPNETLTAQIVTASFENGVLANIIAKNEVVLKTDKETLYGDHANYDAVKRIIIVTGNVRIHEGENILTGDRVEFDLNTNISKLIGSPETGTRVRAMFFPGGEE